MRFFFPLSRYLSCPLLEDCKECRSIFFHLSERTPQCTTLLQYNNANPNTCPNAKTIPRKHVEPSIERTPLAKLHVKDAKQYLVSISPLIQTLAILRDCLDVVQTLSLPLGIAPHCEADRDLAKEQTHYPSLSIPRQIRQQRQDNNSWEPIFARQ